MTDAPEIDGQGPRIDNGVYSNLLSGEIKDLHTKLDALMKLSLLGARIEAMQDELQRVPAFETALSLDQGARKFTLEIWLEDVSTGCAVPRSPDISPDPAPSDLRADAEGSIDPGPDAAVVDGVSAEGGDDTAAAAPPLPEGEPETKSQPKPARPAPKKKKGASPFWDDARCETLIRMKMDGHTAKDIGEKVGTTHGAVSVQWGKIRGGELHKRILASPPVEKVPDPIDWLAHFKAIPEKEGWGWNHDLELVRHMQRGTGVAGSAALLRIDREIVRDRWKALIGTAKDPNFKEMIAALEELEKAAFDATFHD